MAELEVLPAVVEVAEAEVDVRYEFGGVQCRWELAMSAEALMLVSAWLVETAPQRDVAEVVRTSDKGNYGKSEQLRPRL